MSTITIHPSAQVHSDAIICEGTKIDANAVIGANVFIGRNCRILAGAVIGARPFVLSMDEGAFFPIEIADDVLIGSNATIQYGVSRPTRIGRGSWINHTCAIGHDVWFGEQVRLGLSSTVSGHSNIGDRVKIGPGSTLTNRSEVGADAQIGIGSLVLHPVAAGSIVMGRPAESRADHLEAARRMRELLGTERPERRITGGGRRYARLLPRGLKRMIKHILGKA
jgi:UDP-3-O-[3-hydroxymyristoyl] glucosamine N-acyltransferase